MKCPCCGAESIEFKSSQLVSDEVNNFGHRQLTYTAECDNPVTFDSETKMYSCKRCGLKFTLKQGAMGHEA